MPPPPTLILSLIRSCIPKAQHLHRQPHLSQLRRAASPLLRPNLTIPQRHSYSSPSSTTPQAAKTYTFDEIAPLSTNPSPKRILIDVREPSELEQTGRIPGAYSMPFTSNPDAFYLSNEDFFDRFGFEKPRASPTPPTSSSGGEAEGRKVATDGNPFSVEMKEREANSGLNADGVDSIKINEEADAASGGDGGHGKGVEEVIFYCKAGVRSRAAATMAREWEGVKVGQYAAGWVGWEKMGGRSER